MTFKNVSLYPLLFLTHGLSVARLLHDVALDHVAGGAAKREGRRGNLVPEDKKFPRDVFVKVAEGSL